MVVVVWLDGNIFLGRTPSVRSSIPPQQVIHYLFLRGVGILYHFYIRVFTTDTSQVTLSGSEIMVDDGHLRQIRQGRFASEVAMLTYILRNIRETRIYGITVRKMLGPLRLLKDKITDISVDDEAIQALERA